MTSVPMTVVICGYVLAVCSDTRDQNNGFTDLFVFKPTPDMRSSPLKVDDSKRKKPKKNAKKAKAKGKRKRKTNHDEEDWTGSGGEEEEEEEVKEDTDMEKEGKEEKKDEENAEHQSTSYSPIKVRGRLPTYSRLAQYELILTPIFIDARLYRLEHIRKFVIPTQVSWKELSTACKLCLDQQYLWSCFIPPMVARHIIEYWTVGARRTHAVAPKSVFVCQADLEVIESEEVQKFLKDFRIVEHLFAPPSFYNTFRFIPKLEWRHEKTSFLDNMMTNFKENSLKWLLQISLNAQTNHMHRLTMYGYDELVVMSKTEAAADRKTVFEARKWVDECVKKVHWYGCTRFLRPADEDVFELLKEYKVVEDDPRSKQSCFLSSATQAARALRQLLTQYRARILSVSGAATGVSHIRKFCSSVLPTMDGKEAKNNVDRAAAGASRASTLIVSATPYTVNQLSQRVPDLMMTGIKAVLYKTFNLEAPVNRKKYRRLVIHAVEQMALCDVVKLLARKGGWSEVFVLVDPWHVPCIPAAGAGAPWLDIMQSHCFRIEEAQVDDTDRLVVDKALRTNLAAVVERKWDSMEVKTSASNDPGVFLISQKEFDQVLKHISEGAEIVDPFMAQILVDSHRAKEAMHTLMYKHVPPAVSPWLTEEDSKADTKTNNRICHTYMIGQLLSKPGSLQVWRIKDLFYQVPDQRPQHVSCIAASQCKYAYAHLEEERTRKTDAKFDLNLRHGFQTVTCAQVEHNIRIGVKRVYYVLDSELSTTSSIYTAIRACTSQCVLVGTMDTLRAALTRTRPKMLWMRLSLPSKPFANKEDEDGNGDGKDAKDSSNYEEESNALEAAASADSFFPHDVFDEISLAQQSMETVITEGGPVEMPEGYSADDIEDPPPPRPKKRARTAHSSSSSSSSSSSNAHVDEMPVPSTTFSLDEMDWPE